MSKTKTYIFYIDGMTCTSCSGTLENWLRDKLSTRMKQFHVDLTTADPKKAIIVINEQDSVPSHTEWSEIKGYINEIFHCRDIEHQPEQKKEPEPEIQQPNDWKLIVDKIKKIATSHWFLGALGCLAGIAVLILCLATSGLPFIVMSSLAIFSTIFTLALGANSYYDAWIKLIKSKTLTMDSLFALSTASILIVSIASLFVPWLPMMFEAGLLIYGFRHLGIAIEDTLKEKIGTTKFQDRAPKTVRKKNNLSFEEVKLEEIMMHDVIIVYPGEIIPLDGVCEESSLIYNTITTGAPLPHYFAPNSEVLAGMKLADNAKPLSIRVTKTQKESYLAQLDTVMEQSVLDKAPIELKTKQLLNYFIPIVILLAAASGIIVSLFFPISIAIQCAVSVLVSACPCTLGLITPLAVKTGMNKAAENGVQFKSANVLQQTEQIDLIMFDLNGTLTTGIPKVKQSYLLEEYQFLEPEFYSYCAALEKESKHPIGKAIYDFANKKATSNFKVTQLNTSLHSGVIGNIDDRTYALGSKAFMEEQDITIPPNFIPPVLEAGDQIVYVARNQTAIGCMIMTDPLRQDACHTIQSLQAMGKEIYLCTGADEETALRYAQALGIKTVYANCIAKPSKDNQKSKTVYIQNLRKKGYKVAMVGDAANDGPAIAESNIGIAIASYGCDEVTLQAAGIVIPSATLLPIASAFAVSKQTVSNINQNLTMSLVYNLSSILISGGLLVAFGMTLNPVIGVALMIFQACMILMNVYRFKQQPLEHLKEDAKKNLEPDSTADLSYLTNKKQISVCPNPLRYDPVPAHSRSKKTTLIHHSFWSNCFSAKKQEEETHLMQQDGTDGCFDHRQDHVSTPII
ncbi:cation transport ATPase [Legionella wadsworthii]|uniref:Cation transport ATPase n=1 Tax=Legionella wadsworthii TaxID=28088 RepID=A0A378LM79_9GAMM|nr:cation-translocating P-type ATPase [Legionella wadsworthii]STY28125.1 cation transport ATPase [Legionella wadsworthii]